MLAACVIEAFGPTLHEPEGLRRRTPLSADRTSHGIVMTEPAVTPDVPDADQRVTVLERRIAELEITHRDRLLRAELKSEAIRAGMVDLDGLKLVDPASVEVGEDGQVRGVEALMKALRRSKPWLFGLASTSSTAAAPPAQPPEPPHATKMNHAEWRAARAELLKRR